MASITQYETKTGKKFWRIQYTDKTDPLTGKPHRTGKRGFKTKRSAQLALSEVLNNINKYGFKDDESMTYKDVYELFLETYKTTVKESTLNRVEGLFKYHVIPSLGNIPIKKITVPVCQRAVIAWSKKLVDFRKVKSYAGLVFKEAKRMKLIYDNPMDLVILPKVEPEIAGIEKQNFWDRFELNEFFTYLYKDYSGKNDKAIALFRVLAYTGIRKGEALALNISDYDSDKMTLTINKTVTRSLENKQEIGTPKTHAAYRTLALDESTVVILDHWVKLLHEKLNKRSIDIDDSTQLMFPNTKNEILCLMRPNKWLETIITKHDLKRITPHGFRHTFATLALESKNLTIKQVQYQMGHSDPDILLRIYAHLTNESKQETIKAFTTYVNKPKEKSESRVSHETKISYKNVINTGVTPTKS